MIYAPIIICTLNRFEHFRRCIESLEKNSYAKFTEVYISVDYPPDKMYQEGYDKILSFLKETRFVFKQTYIFVQEKNLGVKRNFDFLMDKAFEKHDRVLAFEDDLEVSPNCLEFMNKALCEGCKDERIFGVAPAIDKMKFPKMMKGTAFLLRHDTAGFGFYRDKYREMTERITNAWLDEIAYNPLKMLRIFMEQRQLFVYFFHNYFIIPNSVIYDDEGMVSPIDIVVTIYLIFYKMYVIVPTVNKIRNWGMDGSGVNAKYRQELSPERQHLDEDKYFDLVIEKNRMTNFLIKRRFSGVSRESNFLAWKTLLYYLYRRVLG